MSYRVEIEVFDKVPAYGMPQAKYIARGVTDCLWTNKLDAALNFLREEIVMENIGRQMIDREDRAARFKELQERAAKKPFFPITESELTWSIEQAKREC